MRMCYLLLTIKKEIKMIVLLPLLVAVVGLIMYILNSKDAANIVWAEVGRIMFFTGLLAFLLAGPYQVITLFSR